MNTLRDWHGDIEEFIDAKQKEEKKAWALDRAGLRRLLTTATPTAASCIRTKIFPSASATSSCRRRGSARNGGPAPSPPASRWRRRTPASCWTRSPRAPGFAAIPGLQYDGAIQKWHTCKGTEPIHSTNPCSEYVFLNNTACNLASLNLMKFKRPDGVFDVERFKAAVRIFITAQEILVDNASYPTQANRRELAHFPHAGSRLRQPRLAHHELRFGLRFGRRPRAWPAPSPRS